MYWSIDLEVLKNCIKQKNVIHKRLFHLISKYENDLTLSCLLQLFEISFIIYLNFSVIEFLNYCIT